MTRAKTPKQIRTLNMLLSDACLAGEDVRDYTQLVCGKRFQREMDFNDYQKCIDDLMSRLGVKIVKSKARKRPMDKTEMTGKQRWLMQKIYTKLGANFRQQIAFNQKQIGKDWPATELEARKLLTALEAMEAGARRFDTHTAGAREK